jgi:rare lipoprotein A
MLLFGSLPEQWQNAHAMRTTAVFVLAGLLAGAPAALAEDFSVPVDDTICVDYQPLPDQHPLLRRMFRYTQLALKHRVAGLASYYSSFFDGRKTANGEVFRNGEYSAAHLTLPLGTWIEVKSRATGKKLRLRVNDRGPYVKKFCLDLSQAAAHYLGVDTAHDRHVEFRIIALPGEEPLPEEALTLAGDVETERAALAQH